MKDFITKALDFIKGVETYLKYNLLFFNKNFVKEKQCDQPL